MALVTYNAKLEYATHTITLSLTDSDGLPDNFDVSTMMYIKRADGTDISNSYPVTGGGTDSITIVPDIQKGNGTTGLWKEGDSIYDYENQKPEHIWSIESGSKVYVSGTMNLVESAGT